MGNLPRAHQEEGRGGHSHTREDYWWHEGQSKKHRWSSTRWGDSSQGPEGTSGSVTFWSRGTELGFEKSVCCVPGWGAGETSGAGTFCIPVGFLGAPANSPTDVSWTRVSDQVRGKGTEAKWLRAWKYAGWCPQPHQGMGYG